MFESPFYKRSYNAHSICVLFRYIIQGSGLRFLRFFQQMDLANHTRRLMWAANESNNTEGIWKYGRVALPSITEYRVSKSTTSLLMPVELTMEVNYWIVLNVRLKIKILLSSLWGCKNWGYNVYGCRPWSLSWIEAPVFFFSVYFRMINLKKGNQ